VRTLSDRGISTTVEEYHSEESILPVHDGVIDTLCMRKRLYQARLLSVSSRLMKCFVIDANLTYAVRQEGVTMIADEQKRKEVDEL
jgi:hypothetical protein